MSNLFLHLFSGSRFSIALRSGCAGNTRAPWRAQFVREALSIRMPTLCGFSPRLRANRIYCLLKDHARAQGSATDPDTRPLRGREADGAAGQGAAARPVPCRGRRSDALGPARGRAERRGGPGHGDRQAVEAGPDRDDPPGAVPQSRFVRRGPELDLRGEHIRASRGAAGGDPGRRRGGDGRGPVEGSIRAVRRPPAGDMVRSTGRQLAGRSRVLSAARSPRRPAGPDLFGHR